MRSSCTSNLGLVAAALAGAPAPAQDFANLQTIAQAGLIQPVGIVGHPGDAAKMYLVQLSGQLWLITRTGVDPGAAYAIRPAHALDIGPTTVTGAGEYGLFTIAFDPAFATTGHLYLCRTILVSGEIHVAVERFSRSSADPDGFDPASRRLIWSAVQPSPNHSGGQINFGRDGMLYVSRGDGAQGAPAQDPASHLGKVLRLDITRDDFPADPTRNYGIPPDNPLAAGGGLPEVWAMGLRNPWRWSFDRWNGEMLLTDVGEHDWEEVNHVTMSDGTLRNFGWPWFEAERVNIPGADPAGKHFPIYAYPHSATPGYAADQLGASISGGFVYRGSAIPAWRGRYVFTDFVSNQVWSAALENSVWSGFRTETPGLLSTVGGVTPPALMNVAAMGEDADGELYVLELFAPARIRKIVPQGPQLLLADVGIQGGAAGHDALLDNNDFVAFIEAFFTHHWSADLGRQGGLRGADQQLDNNDFVVFIDAFFGQF